MPKTMIDPQSPATSSDDLLKPAEAAKLLRVKPMTIRFWIRSGRLPALRTDPGRGGRLLIRRGDLLAVLQPAPVANQKPATGL